MRFAPSDEQQAFAATVREVLAAHCPPKLVRAAAEEPQARRGDLWRHLQDVGLFDGLDEPDTVLIFEELGRAAAPGPFVDTVLAARLVQTSCASVAAPYAADADIADLVLVLTDTALHAVTAPVLTAHPGADPSRKLFAVAGGSKTLITDDGQKLASARDRGTLGTSAQLIGVAAHLLDTTVAYAGARRQFGRAIGQFQAVKHRLADVAIALEFARPLVHRAAWALYRGEPAASRDTSAGAAAAIEAADLAARAALQVHGAIGYTAELDLHLWLRRVWALRTAWGTASWHRSRVALDLLGP